MNPIQLLLVLLLSLYKLTLSPAITFLFGPSAGCRFTPTCSVYALEAIKLHGAIAGTWLAAKRLCRCHPWGECGCDPVPRKEFNSDKSRAGIQNSTPINREQEFKIIAEHSK